MVFRPHPHEECPPTRPPIEVNDNGVMKDPRVYFREQAEWLMSKGVGITAFNEQYAKWQNAWAMLDAQLLETVPSLSERVSGFEQALALAKKRMDDASAAAEKTVESFLVRCTLAVGSAL